MSGDPIHPEGIYRCEGCVRQRALLDDLRACPTTIAAPRLIATSDDVNSWPFVVTVPRVTWDALHAIGGES